MVIDLDPTLHLGPLMLSWYGLVVAVAIAAGLWLALREVRRKGLPAERIESLAFWVLLGGIVGARALHVIDRWDLYRGDPLTAVAIWNGGLAILGAVLGGTVTGLVAASRAGLPVRAVSDAAAPGVILGQAIGRLACLVTGDAVGAPTTGFGVTYLHPGAMVPQLGVAYEPVFLYEMVWDLGVLALVWWLRPRLRVDGQLFAAYLGAYAAGKFALSYLRTETVWAAGLQEAQLLALVALALGGVWWAISARARAPEPA